MLAPFRYYIRAATYGRSSEFIDRRLDGSAAKAVGGATARHKLQLGAGKFVVSNVPWAVADLLLDRSRRTSYLSGGCISDGPF